MCGTETCFYVRLGNVLTEVIKLPARNVCDVVRDKVRRHWLLQIFLNTLSGRRQIIPLLQHPNCSHDKSFLPFKIS